MLISENSPLIVIFNHHLYIQFLRVVTQTYMSLISESYKSIRIVGSKSLICGSHMDGWLPLDLHNNPTSETQASSLVIFWCCKNQCNWNVSESTENRWGWNCNYKELEKQKRAKGENGKEWGAEFENVTNTREFCDIMGAGGYWRRA